MDGRRDVELALAHGGSYGEFDPAVELDTLTSSVDYLQHETRLCRSWRAPWARRRPSQRKSRKGIHSSHEQSDRQDPPLAAPREEAEDLAAVHGLGVQTARRALPAQLDAELGETVVRQAVQGAGLLHGGLVECAGVAPGGDTIRPEIPPWLRSFDGTAPLSPERSQGSSRLCRCGENPPGQCSRMTPERVGRQPICSASPMRMPSGPRT